jgi:hypothetical protein
MPSAVRPADGLPPAFCPLHPSLNFANTIYAQIRSSVQVSGDVLHDRVRQLKIFGMATKLKLEVLMFVLFSLVMRMNFYCLILFCHNLP